MAIFNCYVSSPEGFAKQLDGFEFFFSVIAGHLRGVAHVSRTLRGRHRFCHQIRGTLGCLNIETW